MGFKAIEAALRSHRNAVGDKILLEQLQMYAKSEDIGRLIWLLADPNEDIAYMAGEILTSGKASAAARKRLRIRRGLTSNSDAAEILSALFNAIRPI